MSSMLPNTQWSASPNVGALLQWRVVVWNLSCPFQKKVNITLLLKNDNFRKSIFTLSHSVHLATFMSPSIDKKRSHLISLFSHRQRWQTYLQTQLVEVVSSSWLDETVSVLWSWVLCLPGRNDGSRFTRIRRVLLGAGGFGMCKDGHASCLQK